MINSYPTVFGVLAIVAALIAPARAAENAADPATEREFAARLKVCTACHGENGVPKSPNIPIITGQWEGYVLKQLHDFDSGARSVEVMAWMAKSLSPDQVAPTAAFFAKKNWPARATNVAATTAPAGMAVCQACHQPNFGGGQAVPRLAGQNYDYLVESMRRFAEGERTNNADMVQLMKGTSPAQREAMARYLSGL